MSPRWCSLALLLVACGGSAQGGPAGAHEDQVTTCSSEDDCRSHSPCPDGLDTDASCVGGECQFMCREPVPEPEPVCDGDDDCRRIFANYCEDGVELHVRCENHDCEQVRCGPEPPPPQSCSHDHECDRERFRDMCPGGSVAFVECVDGHCRGGGCSSPIGTPCDDDPSTIFDDEQCD